MKRTLKTILLTGAVLFLTRCPCLTNPPTPPAANELPEYTKVLTESDISKIRSVSEEQVIFSESVNYTNGDIIVAGVSSSTPNGILRKIIRMSPNKTTFQTRQASLEEAVKNGSVTAQKGFSGTDAISFTGGISAPKSLVDFNLDIGLYDTETDFSLDGNISFSSDFNFELNIENYSLAKLSFKNTISEKTNLKLTASSSIGNLVDKKFTIYNHYFPAFTIFIPTIPPFPIVIAPKLEVVAGLKGNISPVSSEITQTSDSTFGLEYENGSWKTINNSTNSYEFSEVAFAEGLNAKAYAGPKIDFLLYGIAGPYGKVDGYLNLKLSTALDYLELYGGLEAALGVNMNMFSRVLANFSTNLLDFNKFLARWEKPNVPPEPPKTTVTIQPGAEGKDAFFEESQIYGGGSGYVHGGDYFLLSVDNYHGSNGYQVSNSFIEFPLSQIPSNATITSSRLKLFGYESSSYFSGVPVEVRKVTKSWIESTGVSPSYDAEVVSTSNLTGESKWYEWDVTSLIQKWRNGEPNYGLALTSGNRIKGNLFTEPYYFYSSDEDGDSTKRPKLEITYY